MLICQCCVYSYFHFPPGQINYGYSALSKRSKYFLRRCMLQIFKVLFISQCSRTFQLPFSFIFCKVICGELCQTFNHITSVTVNWILASQAATVSTARTHQSSAYGYYTTEGHDTFAQSCLYINILHPTYAYDCAQEYGLTLPLIMCCF